jgi:hypothetical protein
LKLALLVQWWRGWRFGRNPLKLNILLLLRIKLRKVIFLKISMKGLSRMIKGLSIFSISIVKNYLCINYHLLLHNFSILFILVVFKTLKFY